MATHSSVLAWRIPGTGEPVRLPSMGSHRVGHDWSDLAAAAAAATVWARNQDGPENLDGLAFADSKNPESAFDPQDNAFLSWTHSYAAFHNLIAGSAEHFHSYQLKISHGAFLYFKEKTFFNSMITSSKSKMDWYNILYLNYGDNVTFNFDYTLPWFNDYLAVRK